jgi:hypothetical protein
MAKVQNIIFQFLHEISNRFNLRTEIVEKEWKLFMKNSPTEKPRIDDVSYTIVLIEDFEAQRITKSSESQSDDKSSESQISTCIFEYRNAPNKGRICGASVKSGNVCSKHKNSIKLLNTSKRSSVVEKPIEVLKDEEKPKKPLMISLNYRVDKYIHQDSGMVFFSKEDRVVFGRYDKYKQKIFPLSDQDLDTCLKYGFRVDKAKWVDE